MCLVLIFYRSVVRYCVLSVFPLLKIKCGVYKKTANLNLISGFVILVCLERKHKKYSKVIQVFLGFFLVRRHSKTVCRKSI